MVRLHRVGVLRTATVLSLLYAMTAFVFWALIAVSFLLIGVEASGVPDIGAFDLGAGVVGILIGVVVAAVLYGLIGWVITAIACVFYNWVASFTGGVEFELRTAPAAVAPPAPPPAAAPPAASPPAAPPPVTPPSDPSAG
jgi:hypothetical protein